MHLQLLRNATLRLRYGGREILVDPCLGARGSLPSFAGIAPNPTVDLPLPVSEILQGVELVVVSHLHPDHFDAAAEASLSRELPMLCQPLDLETLQGKGFGSARALDREIVWEGLRFRRTPGQHGSGEILERMGSVMGFVLRAPGEPTLYWAGDTILTPEVLAVVSEEKPDVIVTHSGGARFGETLIIMDEAQTLALAGHAQLVAVHIGALDHCPVTRAQMREAAERAGLRVWIPEDGESRELRVS